LEWVELISICELTVPVNVPDSEIPLST
jgi:hypothetical protein